MSIMTWLALGYLAGAIASYFFLRRVFFSNLKDHQMGIIDLTEETSPDKELDKAGSAALDDLLKLKPEKIRFPIGQSIWLLFFHKMDKVDMQEEMFQKTGRWLTQKDIKDVFTTNLVFVLAVEILLPLLFWWILIWIVIFDRGEEDKTIS